MYYNKNIPIHVYIYIILRQIDTYHHEYVNLIMFGMPMPHGPIYMYCIDVIQFNFG